MIICVFFRAIVKREEAGKHEFAFQLAGELLSQRLRTVEGPRGTLAEIDGH